MLDLKTKNEGERDSATRHGEVSHNTFNYMKAAIQSQMVGVSEQYANRQGNNSIPPASQCSLGRRCHLSEMSSGNISDERDPHTAPAVPRLQNLL